MTTDAFGERYGAALAEHVRRPAETTLREAYELGREAVSRELTVLDLAVAHHDALSSALAEAASSESASVTAAARDFFVESLSAFEMVRRGFREAHEAALLEQRHAAILRQLSNFLTDASRALDATASFEEMLQLVLEQARELVGATRGHARLSVGGENRRTIEARSNSEDGATEHGRDGLAAAFVAWDGRQLGTIEVFDKSEGTFNEVDAAVLVHLAQMASAAVERAQLSARNR